MIPDIMALARDVDRLFRARQDGRQMPVGTRAKEIWSFWKACDEELRAFNNLVAIISYPSGPLNTAYRPTGSDYRTRQHVAMLALTEPDHFRVCLANLVAHHEQAVSNLIHDLRDMGLGSPVVDQRVEREFGLRSRPQDIARTARYLQDLDARLTELREAEAVRAAIEARDREIAAEDALAAAAQEPIPQEDEDAILAMAL